MDRSSDSELFDLLEEKAAKYNHSFFIESDPIQVPHRFSQKENIEIAGFLAATLAWGQRKTIIRNANRLLEEMDNSPYAFLMNTSESEWTHLSDFKHRTFNAGDLFFFLKSLQNIYRNHGGLEQVFTMGYKLDNSVFSALQYFREVFFELNHQIRTRKHISDVNKKSSAKRLNMFLRWMVRSDNNGVDFGLWKGIPSSALMLPLDVHTGTVSRELRLLLRKQNDWFAVEEVTANLRKFDPIDPVKYDFALFGMGVFDNSY